MKNYVFLNITADVGSRSVPTSNMDLFVTKVAWKPLTFIWIHLRCWKKSWILSYFNIYDFLITIMEGCSQWIIELYHIVVFPNKNYFFPNIVRSRTPAIFKMNSSMTIVCYWKLLMFATKGSILDTRKIFDLDMIFQLQQIAASITSGYWIELDRCFCQIKKYFLPNAIVIRDGSSTLASS